VPAPALPSTPGPTGTGPAVLARPLLRPGLRLPSDRNGREWRELPHPAVTADATGGGGGAATFLASAADAGPAPSSGGGPAVVPQECPPLLGQAAPALLPRPAPPAVRAWLAPLGPVAAAANWPLVSDVSFRSAHHQDANGTHGVWLAFREFAAAAGYDARPATERDLRSFIRSVGGSAGWLRCMLLCNPVRVLLVPHPVAELPFVAGCEEYAHVENRHTRLRHRPTVPIGHSMALVNFRGAGPLHALTPVGAPTATADLALEAERRSRGELKSARRAWHGAIFFPMSSGIVLAPARAPLPPAMATRCATPRLLTYEYPPVVHQQQSLLQAFPYHTIQGTAYVMMTEAIASGLLRAYLETHRVFELPPCYYALTEKLFVNDLAPRNRSAAVEAAPQARTGKSELLRTAWISPGVLMR